MESESKSNANVAIIDLDIQDIEGIGPTTAKKLKDAGIISVMDLAVASAEELSESINATKETAASFIISAQKLLEDKFILEFSSNNNYNKKKIRRTTISAIRILSSTVLSKVKAFLK